MGQGPGFFSSDFENFVIFGVRRGIIPQKRLVTLTFQNFLQK
jgi:hypothetical protein